MVELAHDRGLSEEVPPLPLGVAGFQRLDRHNHLPAAGLFETSAAHLAKFTWIERMVKGEGEQGVRVMGERGRGGGGKNRRGGGEEEVGESAGEKERYWSDSGVKELIC